MFDSSGTMIAVARPVSQYKPTALEGQLEDIRYEFQIIVWRNSQCDAARRSFGSARQP